MPSARVAGSVVSRAPAGELFVHGALREIFHAGELAAKVELGQLLPDPTLYAVGALSELRGEVTIYRGTPHVAYPGDEHDRAEPSAERACLLVGARVGAWKAVPLAESIPFAEIDDAIERHAAKLGLDLDRPFPFLIEGEVTDLSWHVIDGRRLSGSGGHGEHLRAADRHTADRARVEIVGFFSRHHAGVFTHMGSRTHMHCIVEGRPSGHVDDVVVPSGATLRLPIRQPVEITRYGPP